MPNLEDLRCHLPRQQGNVTPIFAFSELKKLRHLILASTPLDASFPSICRPIFRNLVDLTLNQVVVNEDELVGLLNHETFPALRHLNVAHLLSHDDEPYFPDISRSFFCQLDVVQVHNCELGVLVPEWMTTQCRVPVAVELHSFGRAIENSWSRCHHVVVRNFATFGSFFAESSIRQALPDVILAVQAVEGLVRLPHPGLLTLYLPWDFDERMHPIQSHPGTSNLRRARQSLLRACTAKGVRIKWRASKDLSGSPIMCPRVSSTVVDDRNEVQHELRLRARRTGVGEDHEVYELTESSGEECCTSSDESGEDEDDEDDDASGREEQEEREPGPLDDLTDAECAMILRSLDVRVNPDGTRASMII
ncbi:hypothetical protein JCM3775_005139 [Rhodotorula graminis]